MYSTLLPCALCGAAFKDNSKLTPGSKCCRPCATGESILPLRTSLLAGVALASHSELAQAQFKVLVITAKALYGLQSTWLEGPFFCLHFCMSFQIGRRSPPGPTYSRDEIGENMAEGFLCGGPTAVKFPSQGGPVGYTFVRFLKDLKTRIVQGVLIRKVKYCMFLNLFRCCCNWFDICF